MIKNHNHTMASKYFIILLINSILIKFINETTKHEGRSRVSRPHNDCTKRIFKFHNTLPPCANIDGHIKVVIDVAFLGMSSRPIAVPAHPSVACISPNIPGPPRCTVHCQTGVAAPRPTTDH